MAEIRQALRSLGQSRWYAGTIIAVMALCVSLSTTVFAIVDGVLFKPLPYLRPAELHLMTGGYLTRAQRGGISVAPRNIRDWTGAVPGAISTILRTGLTATQTGDVRAWAPIVGYVDERFFDVLGTRPLVGGFGAADFTADSTAVLISYGVWQSRFGGRADVVGQPMPSADSLPKRQHRVAGVLPRGFLFPWMGEAPELLVPLITDPARRDDLRYRGFSAITRLPATMTFEEIQSRMDAAAAAEKSDWVPRASDGSGFFDHASLQPLEGVLSERQRPVFSLAAAAAGILMLLGCLNISGLMASRALDRRRDISVRRALGGRVMDIARPLFVENLMVVGAGAIAGLLLATPLLRITTRLLPSMMALLKPAAIDVRVVLFTASLAAGATILASLWPVWRAVRVPAMPHLTEGARGSHRVLSVGRFIVVAGQVAAGLALTLGGALLMTSLVQVWRIDPGYAADEVIVLTGRAVPTTRAERDLAIDRFSQEVRALPGVTAVGVTQSRFGSLMMNAFTDGATMAVTPGFYEAMGLRLVAGRWMTTEEMTSGASVAVMTVRSANKAFPGASAVGRQIRGFVSQKPRPFDVIGVVEDVRLVRWDETQVGQVFSPYSLVSDEQTSVSVVVRTSAPEQLTPALLTLARKPDPESVRVISAATGTTLLNESIRTRRMNSWIFGGFAAAALAIVGVGILGLMAMSSTKRTREIGIRMALGSTPTGVVRLLLREQMLAVVAGLIAGGFISAWALKFVKAYLFNVTGTDPRIWAGAMGVMLAVAVIGAAIPSIRASRIDPTRALQSE